MPREKGKELRWGYRILHGDGSLEHEGLTSPFFHEAVVVVFSMAERGENTWEYQVIDRITGEVWVSFRRSALGVSLEKAMHLLDIPGTFPKLPIIRR